jgi:hypothetical protein
VFKIPRVVAQNGSTTFQLPIKLFVASSSKESLLVEHQNTSLTLNIPSGELT